MKNPSRLCDRRRLEDSESASPVTTPLEAHRSAESLLGVTPDDAGRGARPTTQSVWVPRSEALSALTSVACSTHPYYTDDVRQVPLRELNQHTAEVIARVEMGERVEITRNGTRVAIIEPARPHPLGLLIESGDLSPARGPLPTFSAVDETSSDSAGLDAVLEDRYGDGRW